MVVVGRIARAHGLRGQVIVNLETDFPERAVRARAPVDRAPGRGASRRCVVRSVVLHRRPAGDRLRGRRDDRRRRDAGGHGAAGAGRRLAALPPGTFYHHDLVGCRVETAGRRRRSATVERGRGHGEAAGWSCETPRGEVLIPLAERHLPVIDTAAKRIVVEPPEGLLELNETRPIAAECGRRRREIRHRHDLPRMFEAARRGHRRRAIERGLLDVRVHDLRDFTTDRHRVGGRRAVRRRAGHGAEARADVPGAGRDRAGEGDADA